LAITTHADLITAVASNWKHRSDLASIAPDLIMIGEKWIMRNVRAPEMETALSVTLSSGVGTAPTGFLGLKYAYVDASPAVPLEFRSPQQIYVSYPNRSVTSKPKWIAYDAGSFIFGPFPDSDYTIKGTYYKRQGPLSSSVYDLFSNNPDLYLFAALAEAEGYVGKDDRIPLWTTKRDQIAMDINKEAQGIMASGGLTITTA
jgi:hypothetical protein